MNVCCKSDLCLMCLEEKKIACQPHGIAKELETPKLTPSLSRSFKKGSQFGWKR